MSRPAQKCPVCQHSIPLGWEVKLKKNFHELNSKNIFGNLTLNQPTSWSAVGKHGFSVQIWTFYIIPGKKI